MKRKLGVFQVCNTAFLSIIAAACLLPFLLVAAVSLTDEATIAANGYSLFPQKLSLQAYNIIFSGNPLIFNSYMVSIVTTCAGTFLAVLMTSMCAYTLANKNIRYRRGMAMFFFFTMIFNAGLVPWYVMCTTLGLKNNIWALIVPGLLFNPFNLFLVRNYMATIPDSLLDSARIDGAGDGRIFAQIFLPLCKPVLATVALFYGLAYWNNWFNAIMLVDDKYLYPLQYLLFRLQSEIQMLNDLSQSKATAIPPTESIKMATTIITVGPIFLLYPLLQRYFVRGLVMGSIKG